MGTGTRAVARPCPAAITRGGPSPARSAPAPPARSPARAPPRSPAAAPLRRDQRPHHPVARPPVPRRDHPRRPLSGAISARTTRSLARPCPAAITRGGPSPARSAPAPPARSPVPRRTKKGRGV